MRTDAPLNFRHREVLSSIVRAYIETGEPIGSRTISKLRSDSLSPASIRNVMADLADSGYLAQPHTSAGRIPTGKAFRFFVQALNFEVTFKAEESGMQISIRQPQSQNEMRGDRIATGTEAKKPVNLSDYNIPEPRYLGVGVKNTVQVEVTFTATQ